MMDSLQFYNASVIWTRSMVLILSIVVVVLSLGVYNYNSLPVSMLTNQEQQLTSRSLIDDMIRDRKLIATLVAAQASIFCPLFLLLSTPLTRKNLAILSWHLFEEQICQFLMPLGLALSWLFCITFDKRIDILHYGQEQEQDVLAVYIINSLKYIITGILILEMVFVWASFLRFAFMLLNEQAIKLYEDEENTLEDLVEEKETILSI